MVGIFFPKQDIDIKNSDLMRFNVIAPKTQVKKFLNLSFFNKDNAVIKVVDVIDCPLLDEKALINFTLHGKEDAFFIPKKQACYQYNDCINDCEIILSVKAFDDPSIISRVELTGADKNGFTFRRDFCFAKRTITIINKIMY